MRHPNAIQHLSLNEFYTWMRKENIKLMPHQEALASSILECSGEELEPFLAMASGLTFTFQTVEKFFRRLP